MSIDQEDVAPLLEGVGRFARERIATAAGRPEAPKGMAEFEGLTGEALGLSILPDAGNHESFGLWSGTEQAHVMAFNTGVLKHASYANPGVAFAWHRYALACHLSRVLGLEADSAGAPSLTLAPAGHYGLGRTSLARWLRGAELTLDEESLLADWLDRDTHATVLIAPDNWKALLWPVWCDGGILWERVSRDGLNAGRCRSQHGFDELAASRLVRLPGTLAPLPPPAAGSRAVYGGILKMDMIGLLAIGAGAIGRALEMAGEYASVRRQGGKLIAGHAAVQFLLSGIERARGAAELALEACEQPLERLDLGRLAASRATVCAMLCHAASEAVQVFGGYGYMRDTGVEKICGT